MSQNPILNLILALLLIGSAMIVCINRPDLLQTVAAETSPVTEPAESEPDTPAEPTSEPIIESASEIEPSTETIPEITPEPSEPKPLSLPELMLAQHNSIRASAGLSPQSLDENLCKAAQDYADYLARYNLWGHYAYGSPEYRAQRAGCMYSLDGTIKPNGMIGIGEVLAMQTFPDRVEVFQDWLDSPKHKEALLEPIYDRAGFGHSGRIFVGMFANSNVPAQPASQPSYAQAQPATRYYYQPQYSQPQYYRRRGLFGRR